MEQYEEISLKELLILLLKGWKWIVVTTLITLLLSVGVFLFENTVSYSTQSKVDLSYQSNFVTVYGTYDANLTKAEDVVALIGDDFYESLQSVNSYSFSADDLKPYISISVSAPNTLVINYSGLSEVDLQNVQSNVAHTLSQYLSHALQVKAQKQFITESNNAIVQASVELKKNEELITLFEAQLIGVSPTLNGSIINPIYNSLSLRIQDLKNNNLVYAYTQDQKLAMIEELNTQDFEDTLPNIAVYATFEHDQNVTETSQFSATTLFPISIVLGLMVGVFIVLFMNYWKTAK